MIKKEVIYPFICSSCLKEIHRPKKPEKHRAHRKGLCTNHCNGTEKDDSGYPTNPVLRQRYFMKANEKIRPKLKKSLKNDNDFYNSGAWKEVRYQALLMSRGVCMACKNDRRKLHVDHIKPRSKYPELELNLDNLQVLCDLCNVGKGAWDKTDWRPKKVILRKPQLNK
jgi:5-methylcytosine-specific restriction endonuclease McrA